MLAVDTRVILTRGRYLEGGSSAREHRHPTRDRLLFQIDQYVHFLAYVSQLAYVYTLQPNVRVPYPERVYRESKMS